MAASAPNSPLGAAGDSKARQSDSVHASSPSPRASPADTHPLSPASGRRSSRSLTVAMRDSPASAHVHPLTGAPGKRRRDDSPTRATNPRHHPGSSSPKRVKMSPPNLSASSMHSATALFRRSSAALPANPTTPSAGSTRKYTRPPMSKVFLALHLVPERFIELQARAKAWMLDPAHPDRQGCVGNRGKSDTDMVKLRLFNCVREFLASGVGEDFFGEHVDHSLGEQETREAAVALGVFMDSLGGPDADAGGDASSAGTRRWIWPRDGNDIITHVMPLLRRMVTNERQRMYAIETRRGSAKKPAQHGSVDVAAPPQESPVQAQARSMPSPALPCVSPASSEPRLRHGSAQHLFQLQNAKHDQHTQPKAPFTMASTLGPPSGPQMPKSSANQPSKDSRFRPPQRAAACSPLLPRELPFPLFDNLHTLSILLTTQRGARLIPPTVISPVSLAYSLSELMNEIGFLARRAVLTYPSLNVFKHPSAPTPISHSQLASPVLLALEEGEPPSPSVQTRRTTATSKEFGKDGKDVEYPPADSPLHGKIAYPVLKKLEERGPPFRSVRTRRATVTSSDRLDKDDDDAELPSAGSPPPVPHRNPTRLDTSSRAASRTSPHQGAGHFASDSPTAAAPQASPLSLFTPIMMVAPAMARIAPSEPNRRPRWEAHWPATSASTVADSHGNGDTHSTAGAASDGGAREAVPHITALPAQAVRITISVLASSGLVGIDTERDFDYVKTDVGNSAWAEGVLRVVVEFDCE